MTESRSQRGLDLLVREDLADAALWRQHLDNPQGKARQKLFDRYLAFARKIAREHFRSRPTHNFEYSDVEQLAVEGLLQSIDRYDPLRAIPFQGFARPRIRGNISNGLSKASEANAHFSYRYRTERERLNSIMSDKERKDQSPVAALSKLAATLAIGLMLEERSSVDVDAVASAEPSAYDTLVWQEMSKNLKEKVETLPEKEAFVVRQHYRNGVSFQQIAMLLGLSKGRVSQLHASALVHLRQQLSRYR